MELQEQLEQIKIEMMERVRQLNWIDRSTISSCAKIEENAVWVELFTNDNRYRISIIPHTDTDTIYMGAYARSRKPRAGEDWTRGNDLWDGDYSEEGWINILKDIVGYELVKTHYGFQPSGFSIPGVNLIRNIYTGEIEGCYDEK